MELRTMEPDPLREKRDQHVNDPAGAVVLDNLILRRALSLLVHQLHGGRVQVDVRDLITLPLETTLEVHDPDVEGMVSIVVR